MNQTIVKTREAIRRAIAAEVTLSPDAQTLWDAMLSLGMTQRRGCAVQAIALAGWHYSTTVSRVMKVGLPSIHRCLDHLDLCYAAALFDGDDDRVESIARSIGHGSKQAFRQFTKRTAGLLPAEFRATIPFPAAREAMLDTIVRPYRAQWSTFERMTPLGKRRLQGTLDRLLEAGVPA